MASISVRQLDGSTLQALRLRAAQHGVSMEEEARRILRSAVRPEQRLGDLAVSLFSPLWDGEEFVLPPREIDAAVNFSE